MGAAAGPGRDRLAVWDWEGQGERFATGDWLVSDAERAAAGRETVAARFLALLPANRDRAARRYTDGGLPDGADLVRVWCPRDAASLEARLAGQDLAAWAEDDVLHVVWRGEAGRASVAGGIQVPLWPVDDAAGLWEASVRVRRLEEAVITLSVAVTMDGGTLFGRPSGEPLVFRGPGAPASARAKPLAGEVQEHVIESAALSAGMVPHRVARASRPVRHYLAAGTLEPSFRRGTGDWAARLERAGMSYAHREWAGGHDNWWWQVHLPAALGWLLAAG